MASSETEHTLSWRSIFRILIVLFILFLVWKLSSVLIVLLLSIMLAAALYPVVLYVSKKLPLALSAVLVTLLILLPFFFTFFILLTTFIDQLPSLLVTLNNIIQNSSFAPDLFKQVDFTQYAQTTGAYLLRSTSRITGFFTSFLTVIFLSIYLLIDFKNMRPAIYNTVSTEKRDSFEKLFRKIIEINGYYIRGNLLISVICGTIITIGLLIIGVPFAFVLGTFAGIVDLLPLIGSLIGAVPAIIIAFSISPTVGFLTLGLFVLYQQFENNVLAPNIYNKVLAISPTISFLAVLIGGSLFGIVGAFIALPIAASLPTIISFLIKEKIVTKV
jgi:putative heme transporter